MAACSNEDGWKSRTHTEKKGSVVIPHGSHTWKEGRLQYQADLTQMKGSAARTDLKQKIGQTWQ
jgi:hypothetical protein